MPSPQIDVPEGGEYLWEWFWELAQERMDGAPVTSRDIAAWSELAGTIIRPDEIGVIRKMDAANREALALEGQDMALRVKAGAS